MHCQARLGYHIIRTLTQGVSRQVPTSVRHSPTMESGRYFSTNSVSLAPFPTYINLFILFLFLLYIYDVIGHLQPLPTSWLSYWAIPFTMAFHSDALQFINDTIAQKNIIRVATPTPPYLGLYQYQIQRARCFPARHIQIKNQTVSIRQQTTGMTPSNLFLCFSGELVQNFIQNIFIKDFFFFFTDS